MLSDNNDTAGQQGLKPQTAQGMVRRLLQKFSRCELARHLSIAPNEITQIAKGHRIFLNSAVQLALIKLYCEIGWKEKKSGDFTDTKEKE